MELLIPNGLQDLGAIKASGEDFTLGALGVDMTPLGFHLALLPIDPRLGKMLIYASIFSCIDPILTIAASMSLKSPFQAPMDKKREADAAKRMFSRDEQVRVLWRCAVTLRLACVRWVWVWVCAV